MAYYSDCLGDARNTTNSTETIKELISKISHRLDDLARQREVVFEDRPSSYDPYSRGHLYVAPTCHICGFQGHSPAECQRGYSHSPNCYGMSFAPQPSSYQNNYSYGWPENQNMSYRSNNPEISLFASSNHMQGFRYNEESHNYAPRQIYSTPTHIPQHQEMLPMELNGPPFGQPTTPATVEQSHVQVPTQDEFDDIDKITLLSLEFTWIDEDDPIRNVILEGMKKIKSGKEPVEEVRKIEKNIKAGSTISSQLELSVSGIPLDTCEVPTPSYPSKEDSKCLEEEIFQIEEDELEDKEQDDQELECPSDQDEDFKKCLLGYDDTYTAGGIAHINDDHTYFPHAKPMLNDKYHPHVSIELADSYHTRHVLYSYAHVIGFSIDDLEGITPFTCMVSFVECSFRFLLLHRSLHADQVRGDIPWDPGGS
ncbi:hypothetical protein CFC21_052406 [Triticum aestivum]|uniref:CCHC-type domain-containing protein n=2 Tax=Triticum aestivum TaxID=4565 RepID=A0A9R1G9J3_WHEAT|nr:hypothetical protein CFC21_052406 [Triticum aestivum]